MYSLRLMYWNFFFSKNFHFKMNATCIILEKHSLDILKPCRRRYIVAWQRLYIVAWRSHVEGSDQPKTCMAKARWLSEYFIDHMLDT